MQRLIGVGSALVDHLAFVTESFVAGIPGRKGGMEMVDFSGMESLLSTLAQTPTRVPGGSAANTVVGAAALGLPSGLLTVIGSDDAGRFYRDATAANGVDVAAVKLRSEEPTGRCLCLVTPDSQRTMRTFLGASALMDTGDVTSWDFAGYDHAHVEGYLLFKPHLIEHVLATAKAQGCTVSVDLAAPEVVEASKSRLPQLLRDYVDMVFANEDEGAAFAGTRDEDRALRALAACCETAVVKLGPRGALVWHKGEATQIPARTVEAVDTTAAGDMWAAGFLYGLLTGRDVGDAGRIGARLGAEVVQVTGSVLTQQTWAAIRAWL